MLVASDSPATPDRSAAQESALSPKPAAEQRQPIMLISPTEPVELRAIGTTSSVPERYGADVLFEAPPVGLVGVQRKTVPDLSRSFAMAGSVAGSARWPLWTWRCSSSRVSCAGRRRGPPSRMMREPGLRRRGRGRRYRSLLWSVRARGVWVETTPDLAATIQVVMSLRKWAAKDVHEALDRRGRPRPGSAADGDALHILQGLAASARGWQQASSTTSGVFR
jgi:hypothetical protein